MTIIASTVSMLTKALIYATAQTGLETKPKRLFKEANPWPYGVDCFYPFVVGL